MNWVTCIGLEPVALCLICFCGASSFSTHDSVNNEMISSQLIILLFPIEWVNMLLWMKVNKWVEQNGTLCYQDKGELERLAKQNSQAKILEWHEPTSKRHTFKYQVFFIDQNLSCLSHFQSYCVQKWMILPIKCSCWRVFLLSAICKQILCECGTYYYIRGIMQFLPLFDIYFASQTQLYQWITLSNLENPYLFCRNHLIWPGNIIISAPRPVGF